MSPTDQPNVFEKYVKNAYNDKGRMEAIMNAKNILSISPHPDDSEVIAGGFLSKSANNGSKVRIVVVSDGGIGAIDKNLDRNRLVLIRREEQIEAAKILGLEEPIFMDYQDGDIPEPRALSKDLVKIFRIYKPDLVVTVDPFLPYEGHLDHIYTGKAVIQAVIMQSFPNYLAEVPSQSMPPVLALGGTNRPNVIVPIDQLVEKKTEALASHKSQFKKDGPELQLITQISAFVGSSFGYSYAETFKVLYPHEAHLNIFSEF